MRRRKEIKNDFVESRNPVVYHNAVAHRAEKLTVGFHSMQNRIEFVARLFREWKTMTFHPTTVAA